MATTSLVIKYRPARIALLIRRGSLDDFLIAVRINTLLWGGQFNPLLPISPDDTRWANELLGLFPVDFLYSVAEATELNAFKQRHPFLSETHRHKDSIFEQDWHSNKRAAQFLDIKDVVDRYWSEEFRHKPEGFSSNFVLPKWESSDPLHALFGGVMPGQHDGRLDQVIEMALEPLEFRRDVFAQRVREFQVMAGDVQIHRTLLVR